MKGRQIYYISEYAEDYFFHGGIGIIDAERVLHQMGFLQIRMPFHFNFSLGAKLSRFWYCLRIAFSIRRKDVVIFIHPLHATLNKWLINILTKRKVSVICIIGDINGLKDGDKKLLQQELNWLRRVQYFIVHNKGMLNWLNTAIPARTTESIEFFDFLTPAVQKERSNDNSIVFAGNLDKSKFLQDIEQFPHHFHLFGPGITTAMLEQSNVTYHGVFDPYELPGKLEGSFGLVWDGDGVHQMKGSLGDYMQYVSHHKLSSYILAGLPVIISSTAGAADLVAKYRIGFCVSDLSEISEKINQIESIQYQEMVDNTKPLATRIANGECLSNAIGKLLVKLT